MHATSLPPPPRLSWRVVIALYGGLTLLYVWPLLTAFGTRLPADTGDPGLNTWILWWNAHALPLTDRWWNAPMFYPVRGAFAFSETLLSLTIVSTPVQWLGGSAITAYNTVFVLSFFSAAVAAHALAHQLTGRHAVALVAGVAFGFNPYRAAQLPHIQTLLSCWMPLALLALHRYLSTHRRRDLVLFGGCWLLNGLTTGYFLVFFAVLLACWIAWFVRDWKDARAIAATLVASSLPLVPWLVSYHRHQAAFGMTRTMGEIVFFSADVTAIWAASGYTWLARHWTLAPRPEGELYPGAVLLALTAAGLVLAWRARPAPFPARRGRRRAQVALLAGAGGACVLALLSSRLGGWQFSLGPIVVSVTHPFKAVTAAVWLVLAAGALEPRLADGWRRRSAFLFYALAALVMFAFAWGPLPRVSDLRFWYQAPYAWLMRLPGGEALRVPARFATPMILCLTQAAALAVARMTRRRPHALLVAALIIAIGLDGWVLKLKTDPVPPPIDLAGLDVSLPVLEMPQPDLYADTGALLRATRHGHPLINGYSGFTPPHYLVLQQSIDSTVIDALQTLGSFIIFVDRRRDSDGRYRTLVSRIPGSTLIRDTAEGTVFSMPGKPPPPIVEGTPLIIQSVDPVPGGVRLAFDRPVVLARIELDLGAAVAGFPRRLRVSADSGEAAPQVIWEGGTSGAAFAGALRDPARAPLSIALPPAEPSRSFTLTMVDDRPSLRWPATAVRAFSK